MKHVSSRECGMEIWDDLGAPPHMETQPYVDDC